MKGKMHKNKGIKEGFLSAAVIAWICVAFLMAQTGGMSITAKDQNAKEVLEAAQKAIGGADKINSIKSLIIKGTGTINTKSTRIPSAETDITTEYKYEIRMLLPDNYLMINQFPESFVSIASYDLTMYEGISQGKLLNPPRISVRPGLNIPVPTQYPAGVERQMISAETAKFTRLLIGTLAKTGSTPIMLSSRSKPGIFNISNMPDVSTNEIEFDTKTGHPSHIMYSVPGFITE